MNHIGIYFACVFAVLLAVTCGLILVARATKWKPKPIKLAWAALMIFGAVLAAGSVCATAGKDLHILYWWLLGLPMVAIFLPLIVLATNFFVQQVSRAFFLVIQKFPRKR
jgi:hypothetical protein